MSARESLREARRGWVVEWREAPPHKGRDYDFYTSKSAATAAMKREKLSFKGESLVLYQADLAPVKTTAKQDGEVPT